jgi:hypothetical protein
VGVAVSGAGAVAQNVILSRTNAYGLDSVIVSSGDVTLSATGTSTISSTVVALSAALGVGADAGIGASIGIGVARNFIGWTPDGTNTPAQVQAYLMDSSVDADGALTQTAIAGQAINSVVAAGSVAVAGGVYAGVAVAGSGVFTENTVGVDVKAFIDADRSSGATGISADSVALHASDSSSIHAVAAAVSVAISGGFVGASLSVGVSLARNTITSDVDAYIVGADGVDSDPADHGITATVVYMREIGSAGNLIGYRPYIAPTPTSYLDPQLDPDALLPIPNVYRRLEEAGVAAEIVNAAALKGTSISRFTTAGSRAGQERYYGYVTPADGLARVRTRVTVQSAGRGFTYMYVSTVDSTAHRYGPLADSNRAEMAALDFAIRRELFEPLAGRTDTVLLLVADHGQRRSHNAHVAWLNRHPDLTRMVQAPLMGEGRAGYLYVKHGREGDVRAYLARYLAEEIQVVKKARAVELGLFGPPGRPLGPECDDRTGDLLLLPRGDWLVRQHVTTDEPLPPYTGVHGGLTRAEMLIPFLAYRF